MTNGERALIGGATTDVMKKSLATFERRFWAKVRKGPGPDDCWVWTGARRGQRDGLNYGQIRLGPRGSTPIYAHRASLALAGIPINDDEIPHHTCGNTLCIRPDHLEPSTMSENNYGKNRLIRKKGEQVPLPEAP